MFSGIEDQLPTHRFVRIHKSYIIAIPAIQTIDGNDVIASSQRLPISKNYRNELMNRIEPRLFKRRSLN